jgi:flagellar assembly protein FliH
MSKVIPKEQLTAYQRWELNAFEDHDTADQSSPRERAGKELRPDQVNLPTAADLENLHQQAWQEGYALGLEEGRKAGFASGQEEAQRLNRQMELLATAMDTASLKQDERLANEVLDLALAVAKQITRTHLKLKPELILPALREALLSLPSLSGHHKVFVHPDSAALIKDWLAHEHGHLAWKVLEDAQLEPGGFRFESAHSELDASLPSRWREIIASLGTDTAWIDD